MMNRRQFVSIVDCLAHKNQFVARKVQGTLIDKIYHLFLDLLNGEMV